MSILALIPWVCGAGCTFPRQWALLLGGILGGPLLSDILRNVGPVADFMEELGKAGADVFAGFVAPLHQSVALGTTSTILRLISALRPAFYSVCRDLKHRCGPVL